MDRGGPPALPSEDGIANSDGLGERAARQRHLAGHDKHARGPAGQQHATRERFLALHTCRSWPPPEDAEDLAVAAGVRYTRCGANAPRLSLGIGR